MTTFQYKTSLQVHPEDDCECSTTEDVAEDFGWRPSKAKGSTHSLSSKGKSPVSSRNVTEDPITSLEEEVEYEGGRFSEFLHQPAVHQRHMPELNENFKHLMECLDWPEKPWSSGASVTSQTRPSTPSARQPGPSLTWMSTTSSRQAIKCSKGERSTISEVSAITSETAASTPWFLDYVRALRRLVETQLSEWARQRERPRQVKEASVRERAASPVKEPKDTPELQAFRNKAFMLRQLSDNLQQQLQDHLAAGRPEALEPQLEGETKALLLHSVDFMRQAVRLWRYRFTYKHREHTGGAIHIAALHWEGDKLFQRLLHLQPKLDLLQGCVTNQAYEASSTLQALHLAAGAGHCSLLRYLLQEGVDIELKTTHMNRQHYTALHEASFFQQVSAVEFLLERRADPNSTNLHSMRPLHIAAKQGSYQVAKLLLQSKADLKPPNKDGQTPLLIAIEEGHFPLHKLHMLTERTSEDIVQVAERSPNAAAELMRDNDTNSGTSVVHWSWRENLAKEKVPTRTWIKLLELAPTAAEDLLDAVTTVPEVENANHNPLPTQACLRPREVFRCEYRHEMKWQYHANRRNPNPGWHRKLVPDRGLIHWSMPAMPSASRSRQGGTGGAGAGAAAAQEPAGAAVAASKSDGASSAVENENSEDNCFQQLVKAGDDVVNKLAVALLDGQAVLVPARVKLVSLSGLMSVQVLHALATTRHLRVFRKLAVRAIVDHAWKSMVRQVYLAEIFFRSLEILVFLFCVFQADLDTYTKRATWSFLSVSAMRGLWYECCELYGYIFVIRTTGSEESRMERIRKTGICVLKYYLLDLKNLCDFLSIMLLMVLLTFTAIDPADTSSFLRITAYPPILALVVACRWFQLMYMFSAFKFIGYKFLPLLQSFAPMGGVILITTFMFIGFWHAFLALAVAAKEDNLDVFTPIFRFLFLGDGDGIDVALDLMEPFGGWYAKLFLVSCTVVFSIWILNLFIALTGEAYDHAQELCRTSFVQQRASTCLHCLFRPSCRRRFGAKRSNALGAIILVLVVPAWLLILSATSNFCPPSWHFVTVLVPTAFFATVLLLGDAILLSHPWNDSLSAEGGGLARGDKEERPRYLWICHRADYDEARYWPSEETSILLNGRLCGLKHDNLVRNKRLMGELARFENRQATAQSSMQRDVVTRLHRLEDSMALIMSRLDRMTSSQQLLDESEDSFYLSNSQSHAGTPPMSPVRSARAQPLHRSVSDRSGARSPLLTRAASLPRTGAPLSRAPSAPSPLQRRMTHSASATASFAVERLMTQFPEYCGLHAVPEAVEGQTQPAEESSLASILRAFQAPQPASSSAEPCTGGPQAPPWPLRAEAEEEPMASPRSAPGTAASPEAAAVGALDVGQLDVRPQDSPNGEPPPPSWPPGVLQPEPPAEPPMRLD